MKSTGKIFAFVTALCAAFSLSGCKAEENLPENVTAVPTETTSLTLTVALTEEKPFSPAPEEDETQRIELAVYNPFSDSVKVEDSVYRELQEAAEEIFDSRAFLDANFTAFGYESEYLTDFADTDTELERSVVLEYAFCPLNPEFASTEQELFDRIRNAFTEDYISDEKIREVLFSPESFDNQPLYKTIDGVLCMKCQYRGVMTSPMNMDISILSYDENEAEIVSYGTGAAYPPSHMFMTLKKSDSGIWRLDKIEYKDYYEDEATLLYNAVSLNTEKLNKILGGWKIPDNAETIEVNGNIYTETELDMTIAEMEDFFRNIFFTYVQDDSNKAYAVNIDSSLLKKYLDKYVYDVYYEQEVKLFRRVDAPEWYLPELEIDPYSDKIGWTVGNDMKLIFGENGGGIITWMQPFRDESGEVQNYQVTVGYRYAKDSDDYQHIYIGKELPISERGSK